MRKACINIRFGMLCLCMFPALDLSCGADKCLHAHLALQSCINHHLNCIRTPNLWHVALLRSIWQGEVPGLSLLSCSSQAGFLGTKGGQISYQQKWVREEAKKPSSTTPKLKGKYIWPAMRAWGVPFAGFCFSKFLRRAVFDFWPLPPPILLLVCMLLAQVDLPGA